jgi:AcrR family transcriptional regulator
MTTARRGGVVQPPASARGGLAGAVYAGARRFVPADPQLPLTGPVSEMRQRLLLAALRLFATHGFYGVSMRDLAEAVGIKPASLYNHVASKEQLLADLVLLGHEVHAEALRSAMAEADPDPLSQLDAFVHAHVEVHARWSMVSVIANAELYAIPAELAEPIIAVRQASTELLVQTLESGAREGVLDLPDLLLVTAAIGAIGMRVATWFDGDGTHTVDEVAQTYVQLVRRMVGVSDERQLPLGPPGGPAR